MGVGRQTEQKDRRIDLGLKSIATCFVAPDLEVGFVEVAIQNNTRMISPSSVLLSLSAMI